MTAEIAILNRQAVALAADSAVTIGQSRAWKTANKLFSLSPVNDIGIMIYGTGTFIGYSWEIVAKTFRDSMGDRVFSTVTECGDEFLRYLKLDSFDSDNRENINTLALFDAVLETVKEEVGEHKSKMQYRKKLVEVINSNIEYIDNNFSRLDGCIEKRQFTNEYSEIMKNFADETFACSVTKGIFELINDLLYLAFGSSVESMYGTGVVVAGYGNEQLYPELIDYRVDGKQGTYVRVWVNKQKNLNERESSNAVVFPFAQSDMFQLFMEGITRDHITFIRNTLVQVLNDKSVRLINKYVVDEGEREGESESQYVDNVEILNRFFEEFSSYVQSEMIQPVIKVISTLPKEEMAAMAEALVEITTLRRKVDSTIESVGGPTDVAIISKGDGLVWIKRKHYFDIEINHDFLHRKHFKYGVGDGT